MLCLVVLFFAMMRSCTALLSSGWSDVAIDAANGMTVSQRKKLQKAGALNVQRPVTIRGERVDLSSSAIPNNSQDVKIIHFQRHGQGYHNLLGDVWRELQVPIDMDFRNVRENPFLRAEILDSPLTETGRQQCVAQRAEASLLQPQLVVVSPLQRAIQTALLSFSHHRNDAIPWMAHEGCREELGLLVCNKRRALSEIQQDFPHIDFSFVDSEDDTLFHDDRRETSVEKSERVYSFLVEYIRNRPETEIAVVTHSAWLFNMCNAVMDCGNDESLKSWFLTSEIRSMRVTF
jgi:broad specificity phosphatase PhoE